MLQLGLNVSKVNEKDTKSKLINVALVCLLLTENISSKIFCKSTDSFYFLLWACVCCLGMCYKKMMSYLYENIFCHYHDYFSGQVNSEITNQR